MHDLDHCIRDHFILNGRTDGRIHSSRLYKFGTSIGFVIHGKWSTIADQSKDLKPEDTGRLTEAKPIHKPPCTSALTPWLLQEGRPLHWCHPNSSCSASCLPQSIWLSTCHPWSIMLVEGIALKNDKKEKHFWKLMRVCFPMFFSNSHASIWGFSVFLCFSGAFQPRLSRTVSGTIFGSGLWRLWLRLLQSQHDDIMIRFDHQQAAQSG